MLTVQVRTPKVKLSKHRLQNSQPTVLNTSNLNSFHEYFQSKSNSNQKSEGIFNSRCKTENAQFDTKNQKFPQIQSQSTSISLASSISPTQGVKQEKLNSNNSFKIIKPPKSVNPFNETGLNNKLQEQLQKVVQRTKSIIDNYEVTSKKQQLTEQQLKQEISKLKNIIDKQNQQLIKHNLPAHKY